VRGRGNEVRRGVGERGEGVRQGVCEGEVEEGLGRGRKERIKVGKRGRK